MEEIDPETWGKLGRYQKLASPTENQSNGYIGYLTVVWKKERTAGRDLWSAFAQYFEEWTQEQWINTSMVTQKHLRQFLGDNGVYIEVRAGLRIAVALFNVLYQPWTPEQIQEWSKKSSTFRRNLEDPAFLENITPDEPLDLSRMKHHTTGLHTATDTSAPCNRPTASRAALHPTTP
ncbi:hypothetical protein CONLIGDRAFT_76372 [Coniochaeta ligniaria NRRL 30616]|uniref:Uncharacterized protein n=1 Tax=Coniochaeta ligniaria NRRL 30616 TaxID=1408157 RepID=A0A1J7IBW4_9PEZI|nr:hypothetical protein CONLIGDRAFT_76372 [Coniochaeta ligniaria NRRL 30616]